MMGARETFLHLLASDNIHQSRYVWRYRTTKVIFQGTCESTAIGDAWGCLQLEAVSEEIKCSSLIDWRKTTGWRWGNKSNAILDDVYEKRWEFSDEWEKHERCPYLRSKWVDFLGRDLNFESKSQLSRRTKHRLCKTVVTWRGGLGRPRLGTDAEDFFPGAGHTYPHLDEVHDKF
jgi:hypothetical protein